MRIETKLKNIIEKLDSEIRGAGDKEGVKDRTKTYMEKFIDPIIQKEWFVLDVGAGDCATSDYLKDKVAYWEGINKGIDWENNKDKYNIKYKDFNFLDYPDNSFDLILAVNTLEHSYFPMAMLYEMHRVTKNYLFLDFPLAVGDGGIEASEDNPDHYFMMRRNMWEKIIYRIGFKIEKVEVAGAEIQYLLKK